MAKNLEMSMLLDFYSEMLTQKQLEVVELYYNEDLSLAEISEHIGITRQGVRDSIKRAENQLLECEEKLGVMIRFREIKQGLDDIASRARLLQGEHNHMSPTYHKIQEIIDMADQLNV